GLFGPTPTSWTRPVSQDSAEATSASLPPPPFSTTALANERAEPRTTSRPPGRDLSAPAKPASLSGPPGGSRGAATAPATGRGASCASGAAGARTSPSSWVSAQPDADDVTSGSTRTSGSGSGSSQRGSYQMVTRRPRNAAVTGC